MGKLGLTLKICDGETVGTVPEDTAIFYVEINWDEFDSWTKLDWGKAALFVR